MPMSMVSGSRGFLLPVCVLVLYSVQLLIQNVGAKLFDAVMLNTISGRWYVFISLFLCKIVVVITIPLAKLPLTFSFGQVSF